MAISARRTTAINLQFRVARSRLSDNLWRAAQIHGMAQHALVQELAAVADTALADIQKAVIEAANAELSGERSESA